MIHSQLGRKGIKFDVLLKGSHELSDLEAAFGGMVRFNNVADIDWSSATNVTYFSSNQYSELFALAENHLRDMFHATLDKAEIAVIPFNGNSPTIVMCSDNAIQSVDVILELEPLWIVSFSHRWCFEWRRSSEITSGYFAD